MKNTKKNVKTLSELLLYDDQHKVHGERPWRGMALKDIPFHARLTYQAEAERFIRIINAIEQDPESCIAIGLAAISDALKLLEMEVSNELSD